jgi:hypothetical protein
VGGEGEELDGKVSGVGAEDETAFVEVDEAEEESGAAADGVERGLMGAVGGERAPSLLGREMFRGNVTNYSVQGFDDVVIFVHGVWRGVDCRGAE